MYVCTLLPHRSRPNHRAPRAWYFRVWSGSSALDITNAKIGERFKDINLKIDNRIEFDYICVSISNFKDLDEIVIVALYRRPGINTSWFTWIDIFEKLRPYKNCIIAGNFNSHHKVWNCENTDRNGKFLFNCLERFDFHVINDSTKSRIGEGNARYSNIDLMFRDLFLREFV